MLIKRHSFVPQSLGAAPHPLCASRVMSRVLISADAVFFRTIEILKSPELIMGVTPPKPKVHKGSMMWEVDRPEFVIDDLPY